MRQGQSQHPTGIRIVVADDQAIVRGGIRALLATEADLEVVGTSATAGNRQEEAGLLAVRMLAAHDEALRERMIAFQTSLADLARAKGRTVRDGAAQLYRA